MAEVFRPKGAERVFPYYWNPNSLDYEVATTGGSGVGPEVKVTNFPATQQIAGSVTISSDEATRVDVASSTITYVGKAPVGTAEGSAAWKIYRLTTNAEGDVTTEYAGGTTTYNKVWTNRAGLSYS